VPSKSCPNMNTTKTSRHVNKIIKNTGLSFRSVISFVAFEKVICVSCRRSSFVSQQIQKKHYTLSSDFHTWVSNLILTLKIHKRPRAWMWMRFYPGFQVSTITTQLLKLCNLLKHCSENSYTLVLVHLYTCTLGVYLSKRQISHTFVHLICKALLNEPEVGIGSWNFKLYPVER
jgi:hypothetical protein